MNIFKVEVDPIAADKGDKSPVELSILGYRKCSPFVVMRYSQVLHCYYEADETLPPEYFGLLFVQTDWGFVPDPNKHTHLNTVIDRREQVWHVYLSSLRTIPMPAKDK